MEKVSKNHSNLFVIFFVTSLIFLIANSKWNHNITSHIDPPAFKRPNRILVENKQEIQEKKDKTEILQNLVSMMEAIKKSKNQENTNTLVLTDFQKQVLIETHTILNSSLAINLFQKDLIDKFQTMKEDLDYKGTPTLNTNRLLPFY